MGTFNNIMNNKAIYTCDLKADEKDAPFLLGKYRPSSVMVSGVLAGGKLVVEGTNDLSQEPEFFILNDSQGNPLVFAYANLEQIQEDCVQLRIRMAGGSADTKIKVIVLLRNV